MSVTRAIRPVSSAYGRSVIMNRRVGAIVAAASAFVIVTASCATGDLPRADPSPSQPATTLPASPVVVTPGATATPEHHATAPPSSRPVKVVQRNPRWALDRIDQRRLPFDKRYVSNGQGEGVTVYIVDGLFDTTNAEFGGRASVGLALGQPCVLEDGIDHGMFV